jgi:hypothetical protein
MPVLERLRTELADRYAVDREVGSGGMATVYLAEDLKHGRTVAIKVLHPELAASVGGDRFLREIEIAASLEHPHILSLIDSGQADGLFYYVMPYVEGESLRDRLARERQLPIEEAIRITGEVADGLGYAHRQGVVHRDIKPANIMLSENHALIADFGVARAVGAEGQGLTSTGLAVGTPAYMSPEQASGTEEVDARSDLYALGCMLYEMLAGEPPLLGPTPQATAALRLTETATSLPVIRETVPGGLNEVVTRTLAKSPADRYATAEELGEALVAPEVWEEAKPERRIGRLAVNVAISVVLLGAGLFLAQFFTGGGPAAETDPDLIAVLPLVSAAGGDTALENLGHLLAARISADLDGMGAIRTADYATIRTTEGMTSGSPEDAAERVHAETGAGRVVQGSLTRIGADEVGVELALYDSERSLLARTSFAGAPGDPWALADSVAWQLLDQVWSAGGAGTRDYYYRSLLRGRPFTAVREYMLADRLFWDWERGIREDEWNREKAEAYERAWRADTTLWMASYMNHWVTGPGFYVDPGPRDTVVVNAWRDHVEDLPPAYQLWIEAWDLPFQSEASLRRLREMLQPSATIPRGSFGPIQYRLADHLHHGGRAYGYSAEYTADMMEAAVEAGFGGELFDADHLLYTALGRDEAATQLWFDWWLARGGAENDPDQYRFYRLVMAHLAGQPDSILADSVAAAWDLSYSLEAPNRLWDVMRRAGVPDLAIDIHRRVASREMDQEQRIGLHFQAALAWADRGAWDSVMVELREILEMTCFYCDTTPYWFAAVGEWLGALAPGRADEFRPRAVSNLQQWGDECSDCVIWLASIDGLVASARRDPVLLRDALNRVESARVDAGVEQISVYVARSLRAADLELSGDRGGAVDSLYALIRDSQYPPRVDGDGYGHTEAFNRLSAARWLREAGDRPRAHSVVTELQWPWIGGRSRDDNELVSVVSGLAYLELARIEEVGGSATFARDYYEQFLRRYDMPVEAHRPMVEEARAAYERLGGDSDRFE